MGKKKGSSKVIKERNKKIRLRFAFLQRSGMRASNIVDLLSVEHDLAPRSIRNIVYGATKRSS